MLDEVLVGVELREAELALVTHLALVQLLVLAQSQHAEEGLAARLALVVVRLNVLLQRVHPLQDLLAQVATERHRLQVGARLDLATLGVQRLMQQEALLVLERALAVHAVVAVAFVV